MYLVVFYVVEYVWVCVGVYTKSKSSELSPLRQKLLRFAKQFPPPLRSNNINLIYNKSDFLGTLHKMNEFCHFLLS
jgi:hypothetical protein